MRTRNAWNPSRGLRPGILNVSMRAKEPHEYLLSPLRFYFCSGVFLPIKFFAHSFIALARNIFHTFRNGTKHGACLKQKRRYRGTAAFAFNDFAVMFCRSARALCKMHELKLQRERAAYERAAYECVLHTRHVLQVLITSGGLRSAQLLKIYGHLKMKMPARCIEQALFKMD